MLISFKENKFKISNILYIASLICLGIFFFVGKGLMSEENMFYNYMGFMSIGLGVFSSSVLMYLGSNVKN